jgi:hypothetical protein
MLPVLPPWSKLLAQLAATADGEVLEAAATMVARKEFCSMVAAQKRLLEPTLYAKMTTVHSENNQETNAMLTMSLAQVQSNSMPSVCAQTQGSWVLHTNFMHFMDSDMSTTYITSLSRFS